MFKDKIVLVTGSSRGIGRSIAVKFAKEGANVIIASSARSTQKGEEVAAMARELGSDSIYLQANLEKEEEICKMFD